MISITNLLYTLNTASVYTIVYATCMKSVYCRKSSKKSISFNERTILKWMGRSISVFKGIFPIFGLPSPISGCCKPRFLDFQSRFLVNLPKFFFRYEIHLIFRMRCKFPFFGVISDFRRAKTPKNVNIFNSV